jgi:hypothetical protein
MSHIKFKQDRDFSTLNLGNGGRWGQTIDQKTVTVHGPPYAPTTLILILGVQIRWDKGIAVLTNPSRKVTYNTKPLRKAGFTWQRQHTL